MICPRRLNSPTIHGDSHCLLAEACTESVRSIGDHGLAAPCGRRQVERGTRVDQGKQFAAQAHGTQNVRGAAGDGTQFGDVAEFQYG